MSIDFQPVTLDLNNGEPVAQAILPATKRQKSRMHKVPGIRQFWIEKHIGFNDLYRCWCSASIEIDFTQPPGMTLQECIDAMNGRVTAFHEAHQVCAPAGQETV